jgi:hypothetical protein
MKLNNVDHLSSISFSSNVKKNRNVAAKKTQGFGQQLADGTIRAFTISGVADDDIQDVSNVKSNT